MKGKSKEKEYIVSVCVITYNHEAFIAKSLQGILDQQTNFDFEIVIGDDASTDKTANSCKEFQKLYPQKIKLVCNPGNLGVQKNLKNTLENCKGKYIALCEGDDYWTNPYKLQLQVDFLENNPGYSLCSTRYQVCDTVTQKITSDGLENIFQDNPLGIDILPHNFFESWITKTCTVLFKSESFSTKLVHNYKYFRDSHLFYHILQGGRGYCMNVFTSVYNIHNDGIWSSMNAMKRSVITLNVCKELYQSNRRDLYLKEKYAQQLLWQIDNKIKNDSRPFLSFSIYKTVLNYAFLVKAPGFIFLKLKQIFRPN